MEPIFMNAVTGKIVKVSGDLAATGYVCPFLMKSFMKIDTGNFLPSYPLAQIDMAF